MTPKVESFRVKNEIGAVRGKEGWGEVKLWRREKKAAPTSSSLPVRNSPFAPEPVFTFQITFTVESTDTLH